MWKVLLVIASVVLGGALYLSYSNMEAFKKTIADVGEQKNLREQRTKSLEETNAKIAELEMAIQTLADETETINTNKIDLDTKLVEAELNQKALQAKLATAASELEEAKKLVQDAAGVEAIQKEMVQIRTQIEESEIEIAQLEGAVAAAQVERDRLEKVAAELVALRTDQESGVIRGEFQSQIKRAYNQWGFVVIAGGADQGVVNRAQLDVYRRGQPICRLLVTSVEPSETVADIVAGSLAPGQSVQVGDTVVKTVRVQTPAVVPASAPGGGAAGGVAPAAGTVPAGGMEAGPAPGAAPDPFGGAMEPAPAAAPDPFGGAMAPEAPAPAAPAAPDPFGAPPAPAPDGTAPAPAPAPDGAPAPDPFGQ